MCFPLPSPAPGQADLRPENGAGNVASVGEESLGVRPGVRRMLLPLAECSVCREVTSRAFTGLLPLWTVSGSFGVWKDARYCGRKCRRHVRAVNECCDLEYGSRSIRKSSIFFILENDAACRRHVSCLLVSLLLDNRLERLLSRRRAALPQLNVSEATVVVSF